MMMRTTIVVSSHHRRLAVVAVLFTSHLRVACYVFLSKRLADRRRETFSSVQSTLLVAELPPSRIQLAYPINQPTMVSLSFGALALVLGIASYHPGADAFVPKTFQPKTPSSSSLSLKVSELERLNFKYRAAACHRSVG